MSVVVAVPGRRAGLDLVAVLIIVSCSALWGMQQIAMKVALPEVPPLLQGGSRALGGTILLWAWSRSRGLRLFERDGTLGAGLAAGVLFAVEFACIYLAVPHTNASRLAVFLYLAPFVVALGLPHFVPAERLSRLQLAGLSCAFAALFYAFAEGFGNLASGQVLGDGLALLAALLWGTTTLVVRTTRLANASAEKTLFYQLAMCAVLLLALSRAAGEVWSFDWSVTVWVAMLFQTIAVSFVSFLAWFWLLRNYSATKVSSFSFLTPMFGIVFSSFFLHETIGARIMVGVAFVAIGIWLVNRPTPKRAATNG